MKKEEMKILFNQLLDNADIKLLDIEGTEITRKENVLYIKNVKKKISVKITFILNSIYLTVTMNKSTTVENQQLKWSRANNFSKTKKVETVENRFNEMVDKLNKFVDLELF